MSSRTPVVYWACLYVYHKFSLFCTACKFVGTFCGCEVQIKFVSLYLLMPTFFSSFSAKKIKMRDNGLAFHLRPLATKIRVKGTVSRHFRHFFWSITPPGLWTGNNGFTNLFVSAKIFAKNVCPCCPWLGGHNNDYADAGGKFEIEKHKTWTQRMSTNFLKTYIKNKQQYLN